MRRVLRDGDVSQSAVVFAMFDKDKDGLVQKLEIECWMRDIGSLTTESILLVLRLADRNADLMFDEAEFALLLQKIRELNSGLVRTNSTVGEQPTVERGMSMTKVFSCSSLSSRSSRSSPSGSSSSSRSDRAVLSDATVQTDSPYLGTVADEPCDAAPALSGRPLASVPDLLSEVTFLQPLTPHISQQRPAEIHHETARPCVAVGLPQSDIAVHDSPTSQGNLGNVLASLPEPPALLPESLADKARAAMQAKWQQEAQKVISRPSHLQRLPPIPRKLPHRSTCTATSPWV